MVDLFIAFESNSRKAISYIEGGWPDFGPGKIAFWNCEDAHKGGRVLFFVGGKLNAEGGGALPHRHPGIEQVCYMLSGRARAEVGGETCELGPGDSCFFPANEVHAFTRISEEPVRVLVIYSPPYGESKEKGIAA